MIWDRLDGAVELAVEGRWALYAATWASERAVRVRAGSSVSGHGQVEGASRRNAYWRGAAHACRPSCTARAHLSSGRRSGRRPIAAGTGLPFHSRRSALR